MPFNGLLYGVVEALRSLYRNKGMSIASTGIVVITLLMLGSFMLVRLNINHVTKAVKEQVEMVVFIDENATLEERESLRANLVSHAGLAEVRFVSKEEAMERLAEIWGDFVAGYRSAEDNPLPDSYEIRPIVAENIVALARELERYPGVEKVQYGEEEFVNNLFAVLRVIQLISLALMGGLAILAIFLISHTIRLTVFIRRREIMIMKYVGATNWFIRWPFILEGLVIGSFGAALPLAALYYLYDASVGWVVSNNLLFLNLIAVPSVMLELVKYLVPLGTGLGVLGSLLSMDRFVRV